MARLLIRGGTVVDGSGAPRFTADVAVEGDRICAIGRGLGPAERVIDADGLLVTPGFVDAHTHYDGQALWDEELQPSSSHGVTTVIMGNCGVGFAPARSDQHEFLVQVPRPRSRRTDSRGAPQRWPGSAPWAPGP